jgi:hypothetical protein
MKMVSRVLIDTNQQIGSHFVAKIKLLSITPDKVRPDGFKLNCVLIDLRINRPVLILDNHEPFGYHLHSDPQVDHNQRETLIVDSPTEAIELFVKISREIAHEK